MASQNAPQPVKRTKFIKVFDNEWKARLTESFEGFNAGQVSRDHIKKAEECIDNGGLREERYRLVPFERILNENEVRRGAPGSRENAHMLCTPNAVTWTRPLKIYHICTHTHTHKHTSFKYSVHYTCFTASHILGTWKC